MKKLFFLSKKDGEFWGGSEIKDFFFVLSWDKLKFSFSRAVLTDMTPSTSLIVDIFLFTFRIFSYPNACSKVKKII